MWQVQGSIVDHEYQTCGQAGKVGAMAKKWFGTADTYSIEFAPGQVDAPVVASTSVIDSTPHPAI